MPKQWFIGEFRQQTDQHHLGEISQLEVGIGSAHEDREKEIIDVSEFIAVKSYKAKGKRISTFEIKELLLKLNHYQEEEEEREEKEEEGTDTQEQPLANQEEFELIDDIPFEIIRPGKDGEPDQMTLIFE